MSEKVNVLLGANIGGLTEALKVAGKKLEDFGTVAAQAPKRAKTAIDELNTSYRNTVKDAKNIVLAQGETSAAFLDAKNKAEGLRQKLEQVHVAVASVGKETGASSGLSVTTQKFNGLSNSINQLTREMPAFTYSMQTGFMAVSNNIPTLIDEIGRLKAANIALAESGKPTQSVFKAIASNVFSLQTAMGVGITVLTVYGAQFASFLVDLISVNDELKKQEENLYKVAAAQENVNRALNIWNDIQGEGLKGKDKEIFQAKEAFYKREKELIGQLTHLQLEGVKKYDAAYTSLSYAIQNNIDNLKASLSEIESKYKTITQGVKGITTIKVLNTRQTDMSDLQGMAGAEMNKIVQDSLDIQWAKINAKNLKGMAEWSANFKGFIERTKVQSFDLSNLVAGVLIQSFELLGQTIADIFSRNVDGGNFFRSIGEILVNFMKALGAAMIAAGVASEAFKVLFATGLPAIAAGAALLTAAGVVGGLLKSGAGGSSGLSGTGSYGPSGGQMGGQIPSFNPYSAYISVDGIVRGNNIVVAIDNQGRQNKRIR